MLDSRAQLSRELFLRSFFGGGGATPAPWTVARMSTLIQEGSVKAGEVLFREGDQPDRLYFVEKGRFRMTRDGAAPYHYSGRWVLGGVDALASRRRRRTATALEEVPVVWVRSDDWLDLMEETYEIIRDISTSNMAATTRVYSMVPEPFPLEGVITTPPQHPLPLFEKLLAFFDSPALRRAGVQTLTSLAEATREIRLQPGELLTTPDGARDHMYLVAHGEVETTQPGKFRRSRFVAGAAAPFPGWEARATEPSVVLALPVDDWFDTMEEHFDLMRCALAWNALERERIYEALAEAQPGLSFE